MIPQLVRLSFFILLVAGCASAPKGPPPRRELALGPYKARWVDYRGKNVCALPPDYLVSELQDNNSLLTLFLKETGAGWRGLWTPAQIALLEEAQKKLPSALDQLDRTYAALDPCPFDRAYDIAAIVATGEKLVRQSRVRLENAPVLLNHARIRLELDAWNKEQTELREASQEKTCPAATAMTVYYAAEDETGRTTWFFCDDTWVVKETPVLPPVVRGKPQKKRRDAAYLAAANAYPSEEILRAPRLPPSPEPEILGQ